MLKVEKNTKFGICIILIFFITMFIETPVKAQPESLEDPFRLGINIEGMDTPRDVVDSFEILIYIYNINACSFHSDHDDGIYPNHYCIVDY